LYNFGDKKALNDKWWEAMGFENKINDIKIISVLSKFTDENRVSRDGV